MRSILIGFMIGLLALVNLQCGKSKKNNYKAAVDTLFNSWVLQDARCQGSPDVEKELKSGRITLQLIPPNDEEGATYIGNIPNDQKISEMKGMALVTFTQDEEAGDDIEITIHNEKHQNVGGIHFVVELSADAFSMNWYYKDAVCYLDFILAK